MEKLKQTKKGFTLIELLVVISIISLLTSIILVSLQKVKAKARDARRAQDMVQIYNALHLFYDKHGCLPTPDENGCTETIYQSANGQYSQQWDLSTDTDGFLKFLVDDGFLPQYPKDPINIREEIAGNDARGHYYRYYCYGYDSNVDRGLVLQYFKEFPRWTPVTKNIKNSASLGLTNNNGDTTFICK